MSDVFAAAAPKIPHKKVDGGGEEQKPLLNFSPSSTDGINDSICCPPAAVCGSPRITHQWQSSEEYSFQLSLRFVHLNIVTPPVQGNCPVSGECRRRGEGEPGLVIMSLGVIDNNDLELLADDKQTMVAYSVQVGGIALGGGGGKVPGS